MAKFPIKKKASLEEKLNALEPTFVDSLNGANLEQLKARLGDVTKAEVSNQAFKASDQDLSTKKDAYTAAGEGYKEVSKKNKLKARYIIQQLSDKGDPEAQKIVANTILAEGMN